MAGPLVGGPQRAGYMASPPEGRAVGVGLGERLVTVAVAATAGEPQSVTDRQTDRQSDSQTGRQTGRQTDIGRDRQTETDTGRQRQTDRDIDTETGTHRITERDREDDDVYEELWRSKRHVEW